MSTRLENPASHAEDDHCVVIRAFFAAETLDEMKVCLARVLHKYVPSGLIPLIPVMGITVPLSDPDSGGSLVVHFDGPSSIERIWEQLQEHRHLVSRRR